MIELDGRAIEESWWGPGPEAAPTLVLLHEGLGSVGLWRDVPERLAAATGCGVFAYSRFGYGRSDPAPLPRPLTYMHEEAALLPRVLDAAGVRRCILVGHSDGASIAALHAGGAQDFRVRGLVLIAPHFFVEDVAVASIAAIRAEYEAGPLRARLARHHRDPDNAFWGWNGAWLDPGFPAAFDLLSHVAHIRVPILLIQSEDDPYGTLDQVRACQDAAYCPVDVALIAGARHAPHLEAPDATLAVIAEFADRLLRMHEGLLART